MGVYLTEVSLSVPVARGVRNPEGVRYPWRYRADHDPQGTQWRTTVIAGVAEFAGLGVPDGGTVIDTDVAEFIVPWVPDGVTYNHHQRQGSPARRGIGYRHMPSAGAARSTN